MNPWWMMGAVWGVTAVAFAALWWWCERKQDASWVDVAWAAGVGLAALAFAVLGPGDPSRRALVGGIACVWSIRLSIHLARRIQRHGQEDKRYARMRQRSGRHASMVFLVFFQTQAFWVVLLASPMLGAMTTPRGGLGWLDLFGLTIGATGVIGEAWADRVLARFQADTRRSHGVCRDGPWAWSRHANYFFEWLYWWGYVTIGVAGHDLGALTLIGPFVVLVLLFTATGIVPAELSSLRSRGEAFAEYQRRVSVWIPLPPKPQALRGKQHVNPTIKR